MTFSVQHLPFICKNNKFGCEEILDETKLLEHEKYCNYQTVNCAFLKSCKVEVGLLNYLDHIKDTHFLMNVYGPGKIKLPIDLTKAQISFFFFYIAHRLPKMSSKLNFAILFNIFCFLEYHVETKLKIESDF